MEEVLKDPNVMGYAYTYFKKKGGVLYRLDKPVVVFFVKKKLPPEAVPKDRLIPRTVKIGGVEYVTDVEEVAQPSAFFNGTQPAPPGVQTGRFRPVIAGVSAAAATSTACTIGGMFKDEYTGQEVIVTCAHCTGRMDFVCELSSTVGNAYLQPSPVDGGAYPGDVVGRVSWASTLGSTEVELDVAKILPNPGVELENIVASLNVPIRGYYFASPTDVGLTVYKSGRTTGVTRGFLYALGGVVKVNYGACGTSIVKGAIVTSRLIERGDSGAPVITPDGGLVGIAFATSDSYSFLMPASKLASLGLTPVVRPRPPVQYQLEIV
ncbi:trypsin-like serine protease [Pyrobaculum sp.]|uniref:trypsin-like serine protease n=1 Tax=Pyrobaculum sp. TaxID=2004705 RepID=UPI003D11CB7E